MKTLLRRWLSPLALALLSVGALMGAWLLPANRSVKRAAEPSSAVTTPVTPELSQQPGENDEYRAKVHAMFAEVRRQTRAERKVPDVAALLAIANSMPLTGFVQDRDPVDKALRAAVRTMTLTQRLEAFQQLLSDESALNDCVFDREALLDLLVTGDTGGQVEAVARWLLERKDQLPDPAEVLRCTSGAMRAWGRTDPRAAASFAASVAPDPDPSFSVAWVLSDICQNWTLVDGPGALAWAKTLPDTDPRKVYALSGIFSSGGLSVEEAKAYMEQLAGVNDQIPTLAVSVAMKLAHTGQSDAPQTAVQWAFSLSDVPERRAAVHEATIAWLNSCKDLPQAAQWATGLPPDEARATAWELVLGSLEMFDPSGRSPGSPEEYVDRTKANASVVDAWLNRLPQGADRDHTIAIRERDFTKPPMIWR